MPFEHRGAWIEIDLDILEKNYNYIVSRVKQAKVCAVVKADAYGHGMIEVTKRLMDCGVTYFAVATLNEGIALRQAFESIQILILGYCPTSSASELITYDLTQTLYDVEQGMAFDTYARACQKQIKVHIKFDTGLRRLGFAMCEESYQAVETLSRCSGLYIEGLYSHFARADEEDTKSARSQAEAFMNIIHIFEERGLRFPLKHICNSAGLLQFPEYHFDMVRPGIVLYGLSPSEALVEQTKALKEVMTVKAEVAMFKRVKKGDGLSYGHRYHLPKDGNVITLPLGYADGLLRGLSGKAYVTVRDRAYPIVGSICMDQCLVNMSEDVVAIGEEVTIMGGNVHEKNAITTYAKYLNTIPYEVVCQFSVRLHKKYR
jgi:alanine racemase